MKFILVCKIDLGKQSAEIVHLMEVAENLLKRGHQVTVLAPNIGKYTRETQVPIKYIPMINPQSIQALKPISYQFSLFFNLIYYLLNLAPDVIYVRQGPFLLIPAIVARATKRHYVTEVNGFFQEELRVLFKASKISLLLSRVVESISYKLADKIITVTKEIKNELVSMYKIKPHKITVIGNGVNTEMFQPLSRKTTKEKVCGFIGSINPWQGLEVLIAAAADIVREIPETRFIIAGSGTNEDALQKMIKSKDLQKHFSFLKSVPYEKVSALINEFDVCVAPKMKLKSGYSPLKVFEYLACGKPVVVSDIGAMGKMVKDYKVGIAVPPNNPQLLARAIISLLNNDKMRYNIGKTARNLVVKLYTWTQVAKRIEEVSRTIYHENFKNTKTRREHSI